MIVPCVISVADVLKARRRAARKDVFLDAPLGDEAVELAIDRARADFFAQIGKMRRDIVDGDMTPGKRAHIIEQNLPLFCFIAVLIFFAHPCFSAFI